MNNTPHPHFDLAAFVAQFPLFARAPNGIANLRALILQLAIQGKLTEQNADENAKTTLNTIKNCQQNRIASQEIRQQKPLPKVRDDEKSFAIPSNWVWTRLNDWGVWGSGATPKRDHADFYGGNIPWFKSGELTGGIITVSEEYITEKALKESAVKLHLKGTVLLAMYGATIGKTAILGIDATTNQAVCGCQCYDGIFNSYLLVLLKAYNSYFSSQGAGGAQPNISREKIIVTPVPLPPLEEQQRIVAKVDELMALCDQLEAQQDDQARNLLEANTAAVQAVTAFSSKTLTPQPPLPEVEGEQELVSLSPSTSGRGVGVRVFDQHWQRIATHFNTLYGANLPLPSDMRRGKLKDRTVALENIAKLRELILRLAVNGMLTSCTLQKMMLGDVVSFQNGFAFKSSWYQTSGIRLARNVNVSHGILDWGDTQCVSNEIAEECKKFALSEGDLLVSLDRPIISTGVKIARVREQDLPCLLLQRVAKPIFEEPILSSRFLELWFQSPEYSESIDPGRSNGVPHISTKQLSQMQFSLPPLEEQHRIVAQVDELMALCDTLETLLTEQRQVAADFSAAAVQAVTA